MFTDVSLPLGFSPSGLLAFAVLTVLIATTVNTFAMEAAVIFVPAFMYVYPEFVPTFPAVGLYAAIGLALFVELFGYTSSVAAYWHRGQIDLDVVKSVLAVSVPVAVLTRTLSYYAPRDALQLLFGGMLVVLAGILFQAHRHGATFVDWFRDTSLEFLLPDGEGSVRTDGGLPPFDRFDRGVAALGGAMAGFVAIAIGELTQVLLTVRKRVPIRLSTGTSAAVLHGTIVAALVTNLLLLRFAPPSFSGHQFTVPFGFGFAAGLCCLVGGQLGAYLNSRVPEDVTMRAMMGVYSLVGAFMVVRVVAL
ncbi:MAG: sulfite exporter TauE/SafE family protein [Halobacterium sp.]